MISVAYIALAALVALSLALALAALILKRARESGPTSPELVAYWLAIHVAEADGKAFGKHHPGNEQADRKWMLDTYAECILAVTAPERRLGAGK
jgi:hypothetical protein